MIELARSSTSYHILDPTTGKAICGFPNKPKEVLQVESLKDVRAEEHVCGRCMIRTEYTHLRSMHHLDQNQAEAASPGRDGAPESRPAPPPGPTPPLSEVPHLRHWKSQVAEAKDQLLNREISLNKYYSIVRPLLAKIQEAEGAEKL